VVFKLEIQKISRVYYRNTARYLILEVDSRCKDHDTILRRRQSYSVDVAHIEALAHDQANFRGQSTRREISSL
jgi:hypothetical protein